jgi:ATPase subunit of ABC transporter with duplicated ATPase domains
LATYLEALQTGSRFTGDIILNDVVVKQPETTTNLLDAAQIRLVRGRRYGLIGRNGIGKSTLLRAMATYELPGFPKTLKVVHVAQHIRSTDQAVLPHVLEADLELQALMAREKELRNLIEATSNAPDTDTTVLQAQLQQVYDRLNEMESFAAEGRAADILKGLQVRPPVVGPAAPAHSRAGRRTAAADLPAYLWASLPRR